MKDLPDIAQLMLRGTNTTTQPRKQPPRHKPGDKFLKGPVPLPWLAQAAVLPGKALHVGIVLWFLAGLRQNRTVTLPGQVLREFGIDRHAKYRALGWLEGAGLVAVVRHAGRGAIVTLLAGDRAPDSPAADSSGKPSA